MRRLGETLGALTKRLGPREAAVARELTKLHEECVAGTLSELTVRYAGAVPKGEIVIVVGPPNESDAVSDTVIDSLLEQAMANLSPSRAAAEVAERLNIPRKRAYARALDLARK
jgi:16S rRNA (cytidine1402-2'-O)-methyltransferase